MDALRDNAKAIAAAIAMLVVMFLKPHMPEITGNPAFQTSLEVLISALIVVAAYVVAPHPPQKKDEEPK